MPWTNAPLAAAAQEKALYLPAPLRAAQDVDPDPAGVLLATGHDFLVGGKGLKFASFLDELFTLGNVKIAIHAPNLEIGQAIAFA